MLDILSVFRSVFWAGFSNYTVPKKFDFPRYNMKCSGENEILGGIVHIVLCVPLHFMFYRVNLDYYSDSRQCNVFQKTVKFSVQRASQRDFVIFHSCMSWQRIVGPSMGDL